MARRRRNAHEEKLADFWIDRLKRDVHASVVRHRSIDPRVFAKMKALLVKAMGGSFISEYDMWLEAQAAMDWQRMIDIGAAGWDRRTQTRQEWINETSVLLKRIAMIYEEMKGLRLSRAGGRDFKSLQ